MPDPPSRGEFYAPTLKRAKPVTVRPFVIEDLLDGQLVVLRVVLLEQGDLLEERSHATLDDLREGGLGLALAAADLLDDERSFSTRSAGTSSRVRYCGSANEMC